MSNDSADLDLSFERLLLEREVAIDESMVPFRGRIYFRQYIPGKKHKYGIKLFKLCSKGGYTHRIVVYAGRVEKSDGSVAEKIVFELMEQYLMRGRRLFADNWYSSISLAQRLIQNETDFVGTFRRNRRGFPKRLVQKKQKKGEIMALRKDGITLMNWHDKRPVMMMSTCHGPDTNDKGKPTMVEDYNYSKLFVDNSDQMAAYYPFVVRTCKWYVRLFFHLITQTSLVNAYRLYCRSAQKISFLDFKINIVEALLQPEPEVSTPKTSRVLEELPGKKSHIQRNCHNCYKEKVATDGREEARRNPKRVNTRCIRCHKYLCVNCFAKKHKTC